jgi:hypothetical protein
LEILEEIRNLSNEDLILKAKLQKKLMDIYEADELFWLSRSIENWILKGDNNTMYFIEKLMGRGETIVFSIY